MITDEQYKDWMKSDTAMRVILVEVTPSIDGVDTPLFLSNRGYTTHPGDTIPNIGYTSVVDGGVNINEKISVDGRGSMTYGDIELENTEGDHDYWLDAVWRNRPIQVFFGDVRWSRDDFREVFNGVVDDIDSRSRNKLNIKLRDKLQRLNTPISEVKLGGTTDNKESLLPVLVGECHNIEPLLVNPATHQYQFHIGAAERLIEVRDNGVPVDATATLGTGKFTLNANSAGQITVSAQGHNVGGYSNTLVGLVKILSIEYGKVEDRFTLGDFDASVGDFNTAHPQPMGVWLADKSNVLEVCQRLAASIGAMMLVSRQGLVRFLQVNFPVTGDPIQITDEDMVDRSIRISDRLEVSASVKLGYCQNWTVQTNIESGIPDEHRDLFKKEWLTVTRNDAAVAEAYRLHIAPEQEDTMLLVESDATGEADRRLNIRKTSHTVYQYDGFSEALSLELGQAVNVTTDRFGLSEGKLGIIVGLQPDWMTARCTVQVMI